MKHVVLLMLAFLMQNYAFAQFTLSGTIKTETDVPVQDVEMDNIGTISTDEFGYYAIENLAPGNYPITASKNTDMTNGLTICDLVALQKHILQIELLDSPFKIIAGDLNNSGSISTLDKVYIQRLILGVDESSPNVESWRFIKPDIEFQNPNNPFEWSTNYDHTVDIVENTTQDLIAIKTGDVNNSALGSYPSLQEPNTDILFFSPDEGIVTPQNNYVVNFNAEEFIGVFGFQFTLNYDATKMELVEMNSDVYSFNFQSSYFEVAPGVVNVAMGYYEAMNITNGSPVFNATFNILEETDLSESLTMNSEHTPIASMDVNGCYGEIENVIPTNTFDKTTISNLTIAPNPTLGAFNIDLQLDRVSPIKIVVNNLIGQSVFEMHFSNNIISEQVNLKPYPKGIYLVSIEIDGEIQTHRVVKN